MNQELATLPITMPAIPAVGEIVPVMPVTTRVSVGFLRRTMRRFFSAVDWVFGFGSLVFGLAILSVIPLLNFLSLGYLLHVSGRVAATGRLRDGFVGVRKASVLGSFVAGTWLVLWPVRYVSEMWKDANLIATGSTVTHGWRVGLIVLTLVTVWHIAWACLRGGRLRHFLWPAPLRFWRWLRTPGKLRRANDAVNRQILGLRLPYYFWLGLRGFAGALVWLILPVGILLLATKLELAPGALLALPGVLLLLLVSMHLPFLQTHFARTGRFAAMFELREVRNLFCRAPLAYWVALFASLLFALPLYLLKIELTPKELAFLPSLVFVAFIFPARLLTGWAMSRALRHEQPRNFFSRWLGRLAILPVAAVYALFVYLMPFVTWNGATSLLEQHAFLVPAPLMAK